MAENNTPNGIGLSEAQNAISAMMAPVEDNATEVDAQAEETEVLEAEMLDDAEGEETPEVEASDLGDEDETYEDDDTSQDFDIMAAAVEVNGEEKTVEELKKWISKAAGLYPKNPSPQRGEESLRRAVGRGGSGTRTVR